MGSTSTAWVIDEDDNDLVDDDAHAHQAGDQEGRHPLYRSAE